MANKFTFQILAGENPQEQYDAIASKDQFRFYLLSTGKAYLGEIPLFDNKDNGIKVLSNEELTSPQKGKIYALRNVTLNSETYTGLYEYNGSELNKLFEHLAVDAEETSIITNADGSIKLDKATEITEEDETNPSETKIVTMKAMMDWVTKQIEGIKGSLVTYEITGTESTIPEVSE